jgi:hypothetical protein
VESTMLYISCPCFISPIENSQTPRSNYQAKIFSHTDTLSQAFPFRFCFQEVVQEEEAAAQR